jgi:hypothetical protein
MLYISELKLSSLLDWPLLTDVLQDIFAHKSCESPTRHHHTVPVTENTDTTLLLIAEREKCE